MGLFDKAKKGLSDALGSKVTDALEQATGIDLDGDGQHGVDPVFGTPQQSTSVPGQQDSGGGVFGRQTATSPYQQVAPAYTPSMQGVRNPEYFVKTQTTDKPYFSNIIHRYFSAYEIREDVPVSEFGGTGSPYEFALYHNGECAGVIKLAQKNSPKTNAYKQAREAAEAAGVPFINFYDYMPNVQEFVVERITRLAKPINS